MAIATITPVTDTLDCSAGQSTNFQFTVSNTSGGKLRIGVEVSADDAVKPWLTVAEPIERDLDDQAADTVSVAVKVPAGSAAGKYTFKLRVYRARDPEDAVESPTVAVQVPPAEQPAPPPPPPPDGKKFPWWIVAVVGGVLVVGGIIVTVILLTGGAKVPNVVNMPMDDALILLDDEGLQAEVSEQVTGREVDPGTVVSQDPEAEADVPDNKTIALVIEAVSVEVPGVVGSTVAIAEDALVAAGLVLGEITVTETQARSLDASKVLGQQPEPGQRVLPGTAVNLSVEKMAVTVPAMVGMPYEQAANTLRDLGLRARVRQVSSGGTPGSVLSHTPVANQVVSPGAAVTLNVEQRTVRLPNIRGRTVSDATTILRKLGLKVRSVASRKGGRALIVSAQRPVAGQSVALGSQVTVYYEPQPFVVAAPTVTKLLNTQIMQVKEGQLKLLSREAEPEFRLVAPDEEEPAEEENPQ